MTPLPRPSPALALPGRPPPWSSVPTGPPPLENLFHGEHLSYGHFSCPCLPGPHPPPPALDNLPTVTILQSPPLGHPPLAISFFGPLPLVHLPMNLPWTTLLWVSMVSQWTNQHSLDNRVTSRPELSHPGVSPQDPQPADLRSK